MQDVALVLVGIDALVQFGPGLAPARPARSGPVAMKSAPSCLRERPELAELQPGVAHDARVRRAAARVLVGEVVDDPVELALEVEGVERDVEPVRDAPGVAGVDGRAAALLVVGPRRRAGRGRAMPVRMNRPTTS